MPQRTYSFPLGGGLDLNTPAAVIPPGHCVAAKNFEPGDKGSPREPGGYKRVGGYQRFDGRPSPSNRNYWFLYFDGGTVQPSAGDVLVGGTSGATSVLVATEITSGSFGTNDAAGQFIVTAYEGTYVDDEDIEVSTVLQALVNGSPSTANPRFSDAENIFEILRAQGILRNNILAVPGSGPIRGVWFYNGTVYAIRDNAGATAGAMYASSSTGWTAVSLGEYLEFSAGTAEFLEGETITGAPSGATATIMGVGVTSGSWSGSDAAGRIYIKDRSGGFTASDTITSTSGSADCDSGALATAFPVGGKYEFRNYNFGGSTATNYMWGVNGVGRGFRFDGTDFSFVHVTGLTNVTDTPAHLHAHKKQLFFSIGASLQHSGVGTPMVWNAIFGAAELSTGDTITGLRDQPGDILGVFCRNRTYLLYGDDANNWDFVNYSLERGAIEWSIQDLGYSVYYDDRGIHSLMQTDAYGDLKLTSLSEIIDPLIQAKKSLVTHSVRVKTKNQYRVFFTDNSSIFVRFDARGRAEFMPIEYDHEVTAICAEEDTDGLERIFFGSDDGFVYEADDGENFDGAVIEHNLILAFCHCGSPRQEKRYHRATVQLDSMDPPLKTLYEDPVSDGNPDANFLRVQAEYSYGNPNQPPSVTTEAADVNVGGAYWDAGDSWGDFYWDGQIVGEGIAYIDGQGINVSLSMRGETYFERPHTLQSVTLNFSPRGTRR